MTPRSATIDPAWVWHSYHKPLVKALAQRRRMDSFRFDFAHALYNQPGWEWHMAQFQRDVEEIKVVVQYLREKLGYKISLSGSRRVGLPKRSYAAARSAERGVHSGSRRALQRIPSLLDVPLADTGSTSVIRQPQRTI